MEGSSGTKRNAKLQSTVRTQSREAVSQAQDRIRRAVTRGKKEKLTALLHHITVDVLRQAFFTLKKRAAPGVDGVTWVDYAADLDRNLTDLHARVHRGAYRALPSRRRYIPKADGTQRPLGIAAIEDKIVQAAVVAILTPVYEAEFLGFSYGFRPGRSQHDALDALAYGIKARKINWILDADISRFFNSLSPDWLVRFGAARLAAIPAGESPANRGVQCFRNGPLRVNPPFPSRRRLLASVRGRRAGRHLMWSEGRESPSVVRSVGAATTGPASSRPPSRRRDLGDQACRDLFDPLLFR